MEANVEAALQQLADSKIVSIEDARQEISNIQASQQQLLDRSSALIDKLEHESTLAEHQAAAGLSNLREEHEEAVSRKNNEIEELKEHWKEAKAFHEQDRRHFTEKNINQVAVLESQLAEERIWHEEEILLLLRANDHSDSGIGSSMDIASGSVCVKQETVTKLSEGAIGRLNRRRTLAVRMQEADLKDRYKGKEDLMQVVVTPIVLKPHDFEDDVKIENMTGSALQGNEQPAENAKTPTQLIQTGQQVVRRRLVSPQVMVPAGFRPCVKKAAEKPRWRHPGKAKAETK